MFLLLKTYQGNPWTVRKDAITEITRVGDGSACVWIGKDGTLVKNSFEDLIKILEAKEV